jgi:hypothetical protein
MSDRPENPRLILDLYWGAADPATIAAAAEFARLMGLDLHGLYVEDEAVHALAALPFAREFRLPTHEWGAIEAGRIADEYRAAALRAQRTLMRATEALGIAHAFEVLRGDPTASLTARSRRGDIVLFTEPRGAGDRSSRAFIRLWQAALSSPASVLLVPVRLSRQRGSVAAVLARAGDPAVATAARIARAAGEDLLLLIPARGHPTREEAVASARALGIPERSIQTRVLPARSSDGILHALADCPERMLVLERETLAGPDEALFAIAARCGVPVLLLDGEPAAAEPIASARPSSGRKRPPTRSAS